MLNRSEIRARLYLFLGEIRPVPRRENFETDEAFEVASDDWVAWQLTPETQPLNEEEADRFLVGFNWLIEQVQSMNEDEMTDEEIMVPFYDAAKMVFGEKGIRQFFRYAYIILFHSESGPRWSQVIRALGVDGFLRVVDEKTSSFN